MHKLSYVPILEELDRLLSKEEVCRAVFLRQSSESDFIKCFSDGFFCSSNELFSAEEFSIQIALYSDAFQPCNPLGIYARKNKIEAVYYTIGNLDRKHRSSIKDIRLALLVKSVSLMIFGAEAVYKCLIDDILRLENDGIFVNHLNRNIRGTVSYISADNLGAHACRNSTKPCVCFYSP